MGELTKLSEGRAEEKQGDVAYFAAVTGTSTVLPNPFKSTIAHQPHIPQIGDKTTEKE